MGNVCNILVGGNLQEEINVRPTRRSNKTGVEEIVRRC